VSEANHNLDRLLDKPLTNSKSVLFENIFFEDGYYDNNPKNRGQNTVFANILVTIRDNKPHGSDKCRANQDLSYLELRNMLYNGVIIASLVFTPNRIIGKSMQFVRP
jgi:hypothetical protein